MTRFIKRRNEIKKPNLRKKVGKSSTTDLKCIICGEPATGQYTVDIDLPKFGFCKEHNFNVFMYMSMLATGKPEDANSWLNFAKKYANEQKNKRVPQATSKKRKRNSKGE